MEYEVKQVHPMSWDMHSCPPLEVLAVGTP